MYQAGAPAALTECGVSARAGERDRRCTKQPGLWKMHFHPYQKKGLETVRSHLGGQRYESVILPRATHLSCPVIIQSKGTCLARLPLRMPLGQCTEETVIGTEPRDVRGSGAEEKRQSHP